MTVRICSIKTRESEKTKMYSATTWPVWMPACNGLHVTKIPTRVVRKSKKAWKQLFLTLCVIPTVLYAIRYETVIVSPPCMEAGMLYLTQTHHFPIICMSVQSSACYELLHVVEKNNLHESVLKQRNHSCIPVSLFDTCGWKMHGILNSTS